MRIVYFDHARGCAEPPYREGEAGAVWLDSEGVVTSGECVPISPNSLHALQALGVAARLAELDWLVGPLAPARDAVIAPAAVAEATRIFYAADRMTYGVRHDLLVARAPGPEGARAEGVEYRLVVDNREYQRTLSRLQFLSGGAERMGHGLRLRL